MQAHVQCSTTHRWKELRTRAGQAAAGPVQRVRMFRSSHEHAQVLQGPSSGDSGFRGLPRAHSLHGRANTGTEHDHLMTRAGARALPMPPPPRGALDLDSERLAEQAQAQINDVTNSREIAAKLQAGLPVDYEEPTDFDAGEVERSLVAMSCWKQALLAVEAHTTLRGTKSSLHAAKRSESELREEKAAGDMTRADLERSCDRVEKEVKELREQEALAKAKWRALKASRKALGAHKQALDQQMLDCVDSNAALGARVESASATVKDLNTRAAEHTRVLVRSETLRKRMCAEQAARLQAARTRLGAMVEVLPGYERVCALAPPAKQPPVVPGAAAAVTVVDAGHVMDAAGATACWPPALKRERDPLIHSASGTGGAEATPKRLRDDGASIGRGGSATEAAAAVAAAAASPPPQPAAPAPAPIEISSDDDSEAPAAASADATVAGQHEADADKAGAPRGASRRSTLLKVMARLEEDRWMSLKELRAFDDRLGPWATSVACLKPLPTKHGTRRRLVSSWCAVSPFAAAQP